MNVFGDVKDAFITFLEFLHESGNLSFGWAIVAITLMVRLLILPLFLKQYRSMRRMQAYAPQIKELQARHKGNRQKLNEEMMKFYKENQINPFSSCLPLVAQAPVFIVLYYALRDFAKEAAKADLAPGALEFMWVIPNVGEDLLKIGWGAGVLLAIYAISQLLASELNMTPATAANQKWMMRGLPLIIVFFVTTFPVPSGVVIYWVTTNLWTCGQQLVIKRKIGPNPFIEEATEAAAARPTKSGSRTPPKGELGGGGAGPAAAGNGQAPDAGGRRRPRRPPPAAPAGDEPEVADAGFPDTPEEVAAAPDEAPAAPAAPARPPKGSTPRQRGGSAQAGRRQPPRKKKR